jgi:hypothetical protein
MAVVQWTWVKAHAGYLLNERADMLATKGVRNETPPARVQYVHPINEDTDTTEYSFKDNELPIPPSNWTGDSIPPVGALYSSTRLNLTSVQAPALPESSPFSVMLSDSDEVSEEESSNPWPAPATDSENEDKKGPAQLFPTIVSLPTPPAAPVHQAKPLWWTEAWDMLDGIESEDLRVEYLVPVCGEHFLARCESDIHAIDNYCSRTVYDEESGESRIAEEQDDMQQTVCGVMWSDEVITLSEIGW